MNSIFELAVLALLAILIVYVSILAGRLQQLERSTRILLQNVVPSERVRALAADPNGRIEAMRAFREETGVNVKVAQAVIGSLERRRYTDA
jgi:hypothetical protein